MYFDESKPIYIQIADLICDKILNSEWIVDGRIPSVRELGCVLEVNPNTVVRAYESLSERGITYNKRGLGFFVSAQARDLILAERRCKLVDKELLNIAKLMVQLDLSVDDVVKDLQRHLSDLNGVD